MLIRRSLLALCLAAAAGFLAASASSSSSAKRATSAETGCAASPSAQEAMVAGDRTLPGSGLDGVCAASRSDVWTPASSTTATASTVARQSFLIEAQVLEKYRSFRESLSSP